MTIKRKFIYQKENSSKFWNCWIVDRTLFVEWGRIGRSPTSKKYEFHQSWVARGKMTDTIRLKLRKGYREIKSEEFLTVEEQLKKEKEKSPYALDTNNTPEDPEIIERFQMLEFD